MKYKLLFLTTFSYLNAIIAQDSIHYGKKWFSQPMIGVNLPLNRLFKGALTDALLGYDDRTFYWQLLSATYFFKPNWGVEFSFQGRRSHQIADKSSLFINHMNHLYDKDYFVTSTTGSSFNQSTLIGGDVENGNFTLVHRYASNRWLLHSKLSFGVLSFSGNWGRVFLKEKNTNTIKIVEYTTESKRRPNDCSTLTTGVTLGYRLMKRFFWNVDVNFSYFNPKLTYLKTVTDLNTETKEIETITYDKNLFHLNIGTGILFALSRN